MAKRGGIRNRSHRKKLQVSDLDITSLLDICTILLCFLIQSYDTSNVQIDVPNEIKLPSSKSQTIKNQAILVQVSATKIWVDRVLIVDASNAPENFIDDNGRRIVPLFDELVKKREIITRSAQTIQNANPFSGLVNLVVDKSVKYSYLKKLMYTAAQAGFKEYKFIVRGVEN